MGTSIRPFAHLAAAILTFSLLLPAACDQQPAGAPGAARPRKTLTVVTPHSEDIRETFARGFADWCVKNRNVDVNIEWIHRGTPQCVALVADIPELRAAGAPHPTVDVMFGGGIGDHARLASGHLSLALDLGDVLKDLPAEVNGLPTRGPEGRWYATGFSSFGILYNDRACRERGIAPPTSFADLADARFHGWVGVANPAASGSHLQCLMLVVHQQGWQEGWATIVRILGNARGLGQRSSEVLDQVESGVALAAFAVNFDGMARAANNDDLNYFDVPETAVTPDVMSVVATTREAGLATDFVRYVLGDEGQALWGVAKQHRDTSGETLYHYPILPAVYADYGDKMAVGANPLEAPFGQRLDLEKATRQAAALKPLVQAVCGPNHIRLQRLCGAAEANPAVAATLAELLAPPMDEDAAYKLGADYDVAHPDAAQAQLRDLTASFAERFGQFELPAGG